MLIMCNYKITIYIYIYLYLCICKIKSKFTEVKIGVNDFDEPTMEQSKQEIYLNHRLKYDDTDIDGDSFYNIS